jgi:hypothetical protein
VSPVGLVSVYVSMKPVYALYIEFDAGFLDVVVDSFE